MSRKSTKPIHFHQYERFNWPNGKPYYKCIQPGCPHYLPIALLAIGRESLCHGFNCNKLVVITKEDVVKEVKFPMCSDCKDKRRERREELRNVGG
jgi:hypothetical protein